MKDLNEKKVAALLSGGVDSSVAVALLVEQGVRPDLWYMSAGSCTWLLLIPKDSRVTSRTKCTATSLLASTRCILEKS